mmetsp:Transcript_22058/g.33707  ORF Transcript_22058/g.33707 Transcript_22058/m.33707 type:complete len:215 (-) Transcript_22058:1376-2020(-)
MAPIRQRDRQHVIHTVQHHILVVGRGVVFRCRNVQKPHVIKDCAEPGDSCCSGACNQHKTLLGIVGWAEDGQTCVDSPQGQDVFAIGNQLSPDQGGERQRPHICVLPFDRFPTPSRIEAGDVRSIPCTDSTKHVQLAPRCHRRWKPQSSRAMWRGWQLCGACMLGPIHAPPLSRPEVHHPGVHQRSPIRIDTERNHELGSTLQCRHMPHPSSRP